MTKKQIQAEIDALRSITVHVETNSGTFGAAEAARRIGSGDPQFSLREVYETVAGDRWVTGPSEGRAPGYMRQINSAALAAHRARLAELLRMLPTAT